MLQTSPASSLFSPLRHTRYRSLWLANLLSNLGGWMHVYAASWWMASNTTSAATVTLVQAATWAPMMLFALPAGILADAVHRARLLFFVNAAMLLFAACMALLDYTGMASARLLLLLTFLMGTGAAFRLPAWQASMSTMVSTAEIAATASLNNLSYNLSALAGPLLGAALLVYSGTSGLFLFNALSFLGLLGNYRQWLKQESIQPTTAFGGLKATCTTVWHSRGFRQLLMHVSAIYFSTSAFASLLPLLVRDVLHKDAGSFALLMGCLGAGAVLGAFFLPAMRHHFSKGTMFVVALLVFGGMLLILGLYTNWIVLLCTVLGGGMAWSFSVTTLNSLAQSAFPNAFRARTISIYLLAAASGQTLGSMAWGMLAQVWGVQIAYMTAASLMLLCACFVGWKSDFLEGIY